MEIRKLSTRLAAILAALFLAGCTLPQPPTPPTPPQTLSSQPATQPTDPVTGTLQIHFLDVGQADCALLECDGEYILIDGGNVSDSALVVSYLERAGVSSLEAVFCSHAHEDHVGGLSGVLAVYPTDAVYAPTRTHASQCFDDFVHYTDQQELTITVPQPGDTLTFGGATVEVLGPVKSYPDPNDTSLVLMVTYGDTRALFTGDMEISAEADLIDSGAVLDADLLKVGHHGSDTSTGYRFVYEVSPRYAVISVGADNDYGHPCEAPLSRLEDADATIYRTDRLGHILATSDGTDFTFTWQTGNAPSAPEDTVYIGNQNSRKLHRSDCGSLPSEKNRIYFHSYREALDLGYDPCSQCLG